MWKSNGSMKFPIYGKKHVPNPQPEVNWDNHLNFLRYYEQKNSKSYNNYKQKHQQTVDSFSTCWCLELAFWKIWLSWLVTPCYLSGASDPHPWQIKNHLVGCWSTHPHMVLGIIIPSRLEHVEYVYIIIHVYIISYINKHISVTWNLTNAVTDLWFPFQEPIPTAEDWTCSWFHRMSLSGVLYLVIGKHWKHWKHTTKSRKSRVFSSSSRHPA